MFRNRSFENGPWKPTEENVENGWHYPFRPEGDTSPGVQELKLPDKWSFRWADEAVKNPISSDECNRFGRPEVTLLAKKDLPDHEKELFVIHGERTLKVFRGYGAWYCGFYQIFGLEDAFYEARVNIFNDAIKDYEGTKKVPSIGAKDCRVRVVINGKSLGWRPLFPQAMRKEKFLFRAKGKTRIEVEIMMPYALRNSGIFADLWNVVEIHKIEECPEIWGLPREQYARTYMLIHPDLSREWVNAAITGGYETFGYTLGRSADDAGIGQLSTKRVIAINPHMWKDSLGEFYEEYYPHVEYLSITTDTPEKLVTKIKNSIFDGETPPDDTYDGPTYPKLTRGHWGLHVQVLRDGVWTYLQDTTPGIMKYFGLTDVELSINMEPRTPVVYRHYVKDQPIPNTEDGIRIAARSYIAKFRSDAHGVAERLAQYHDFRPLFWIESYNEMYPSLNREQVRKAAVFDKIFAEEMYKEFGDYIGAALFCAAVGNPHETEYNELIRVAEAAVEYNGLLGYHAYWWANQEENGLVSWWKFHAGRWMEMDKYFRQYKLYPRWYSGEAGVVYSPDGYGLNPGAGWKHPEVHNGNIDKLMDDLMVTEDLLSAWNKALGNRFLGFTFFTTGAHWTGWDYFQFQKEEMRTLSEKLKEKYPEMAVLGPRCISNLSKLRKRVCYKVRRGGRLLR